MKKVIAFLLICALVLAIVFLVVRNNKNNETIFNDGITAQNYTPVGKYTDVTQNQTLEEYVGYYGDDESVNACIFYVDENTIDFECYVYRAGSIIGKDVTIDRNGVGQFYDDEGLVMEGIIRFKDGKVQIEPLEEEDEVFFEDLEGNMLVLEKKSTKIMTEEEERQALENALNDYENIDQDIFEIASNGTRFISIKLKPTIYIEYFEKYEGIEDRYYLNDEEGHYYTIDKENKRFITLEDLYPDMQALNDAIIKKVEEKKIAWKNSSTEEWPYEEFEGIGAWEYFENYFKVDEKNSTVSIRVIEYPSESQRALGDVWVDIPLNI